MAQKYLHDVTTDGGGNHLEALILLFDTKDAYEDENEEEVWDIDYKKVRVVVSSGDDPSHRPMAFFYREEQLSNTLEWAQHALMRLLFK